jgi:peptidoglycan/LPS O-acetylase OafA/YrhL
VATPRGRILSLDALRGLLALGVAVYHFGIWLGFGGGNGYLAGALAKVGNHAVPAFFALSGFCFFWLYSETRWTGAALKSFYVKRFARIAPLYYLVIGVVVAGLGVAGRAPTPRWILENLTFTWAFVHPNRSLAVGGWSIGLEWLFYFAFPFLAAGARRRRAFLPLATVALVLASAPWTLRWVWAAPIAGDQRFHTYVHPLNHAFLFLAGGWMAQVWDASPRRLGAWAFRAGVAAWVGTLVFAWTGFYDHFEVLVGWPRYGLVAWSLAGLALFAWREAPADRLWRALAYLGDLSYGIYLVHPLIRPLVEGRGPWTGLILGLGLTLGTCAMIHTTLERTVLAWVRRVTAKPREEAVHGHPHRSAP